ncbi:hypothetical protein, partial [Planomicrobium okeanokoites]|uniref:hypothetical protein n=1 Tax=Planomicrobium okeanokoites TaxID=244 RepID=UPI0024925CAF
FEGCAPIAGGDHRKSRSRAKALVTSFVDVLLFSFQGSNDNAALIGDFINISCLSCEVNTILKYFFGLF